VRGEKEKERKEERKKKKGRVLKLFCWARGR